MYASGTASGNNLTDQYLFGTQYEGVPYDIYLVTVTGLYFNLNNGTYWLNLQNAQMDNGDPVYWDENEGPSQASESSVGTIPSESFTIFGNNYTSTTWGTTPEPGSMWLLGSGIFGLAGMLRRRLF